MKEFNETNIKEYSDALGCTPSEIKVLYALSDMEPHTFREIEHEMWMSQPEVCTAFQELISRLPENSYVIKIVETGKKGRPYKTLQLKTSAKSVAHILHRQKATEYSNSYYGLCGQFKRSD